MKRLWKPVLVAVTWASAVASGYSAEPAVRCQLQLVPRAPLPAAWQEAKKVIAFHCVDSQSFHRRTEKGVTIASSEGDFREVVKKEPAKYLAERPFRGVAKLGSKQYVFVLDHKGKKSTGYDRLYFDLNGNGDLTDDKPIDALPSTSQTTSSTTYDKSEFPRVVLTVDVEGKKVDYPVSLTREYVRQPDYEYVRLYLTVDAYRRGEITLNGKKHTIAVLDWNSNGRFDDVLGEWKGEYVPKSVDMLLIDPEKLADKDLGWNRPLGEHRQFLGSLTVFEGEYYAVRVSPMGDELTWTPLHVPSGQVASPHAPCHVDLISEMGWLDLDLEKSKPATVPVGKWRLHSYSIAIKDWKAPEEKETKGAEPDRSWLSRLKEAFFGSARERPAPPAPLQGPANLSRVSAEGTIDGAPVTVEAGRTTTLSFGPPYKPVVTVFRRQDTTDLELRLKGAGGEVVDRLTVNGRAPDKPTFTITDPKGAVVAQGEFEYG